MLECGMHVMNYLAITSIYPRPFFRGLTVLAFLAWGAPRRSSIESTWLRLFGSGIVEPETDLGADCRGAPGVSVRVGAEGSGGGGELIFGMGIGEEAGLGVGMRGPGVPVLLPALLEGADALGGGGSADAAVFALLGSFLLTHLFKSLS